MPRQSPVMHDERRAEPLGPERSPPQGAACRSCRAIGLDGIPASLVRCRPIILSIPGFVAKGLGGVRLGCAGRPDGGHLHRVGLPVHIACSPMRPTCPLGSSLP